MATEMARWTAIGMALGAIVFICVIVYVFLNVTPYTEEQKVEINKGIVVNCTGCLEKENSTCIAETLRYTPWGVICNASYVRNCSQTCRQV